MAAKQNENKRTFEVDWEFFEAIADRMAKNKHRYAPWSWKKDMDVNLLKEATMRHAFEMMKDNYEDDGSEFGHLEAIACNIMMLIYNLKNNGRNRNSTKEKEGAAH